MTTDAEIEQLRAMAGLTSNATVRRQLGLTQKDIDDNERMWAEEEKAHREEREYQTAFHRERMEALKTLFPRGHSNIPNMDLMVDIARADQLNPLYEKVLKDFDDAKLMMSRAANKLAQAVKLTDSEKLEEMTGKLLGSHTSTSGGIGVHMKGTSTANWKSSSGTLSNAMVGPPGAMGMIGPKGDKGDPGPVGPPGKSAGEILFEKMFSRNK